ncbi:receptor-type tyrosine-protein phosphatase F-like [Liolophura sinensis]|uniref:receptor-type tyrosine-protein phosphatase F-like n=1 Tax=Liolophura sinensis TaxID=3198878 RepID=UPI0031593A43
MEYRVKAFSCTAGGCTETKYVGGYRTKEEKDYKTIIIAVSVSCGLAIIILLIVIVVITVRSKHQKQKDTSYPESDVTQSPIFIPFHEEPEPEDYPTSKPINLSELNDVVEGMHHDSKLTFSQEYLWLKTLSPKLPVTAASLEDNRVKNRYTDILPFDDTRVKLLPVEDDEASDYINANYIPGYHSQREYIAAQGPLNATLEDFWRMVWEQDVSIIVMLTKLQEKGQDKCVKYWPDESDGVQQYGEVVVEPASYSNLNTYDLREFSISVGSIRRKLKHFHYLMWPDFGVSDSEDMVNFLQDVRSHVRPNMSGPLLIHCSAGVGRTGSFIAVDQIREKLYDLSGESDITIDIYEIVLTMRNHRPRMVQTEAQYVFIHDAVCEVVRQKLIQEQPEDEHIYGNQGFNTEENLYENTKFEEVVYGNVATTEL